MLHLYFGSEQHIYTLVLQRHNSKGYSKKMSFYCLRFTNYYLEFHDFIQRDLTIFRNMKRDIYYTVNYICMALDLTCFHMTCLDSLMLNDAPSLSAAYQLFLYVLVEFYRKLMEIRIILCAVWLLVNLMQIWTNYPPTCYVWYVVLFVVLYIVMVYDSVLHYRWMGCQNEWHMSLNDRVMYNVNLCRSAFFYS